MSLDVGWKRPIYYFIQTHFSTGLGKWLSYQHCKTERNTILSIFSFLSKDIVIHIISSILGRRNLLHFSAKGIDNYFCNCLQYCLSFFFFLSKARSASLTEMHVRLHGRFHFNSTLLKCPCHENFYFPIWKSLLKKWTFAKEYFDSNEARIFCDFLNPTFVW